MWVTLSPSSHSNAYVTEKRYSVVEAMDEVPEWTTEECDLCFDNEFAKELHEKYPWLRNKNVIPIGLYLDNLPVAFPQK